MSDPRDEFLKLVDFNLSEVKEYPRIAFLCGGSPIVLTDNSGSQFFPSVRSFISRLLTIRHSDLRFQNAEDVKDWNSYSAYDDLIEFEQDIAHICKAIVLFVESAGSLAELGSFAIIPEVTQKLIIFVHQDYADSHSFVSLGPLKKIDNLKVNDDKSNIHYIKWEVRPITINNEKIEVIVDGSMTDWDVYTCDAIKALLDESTRINHSSDEYCRTKEALFIHDIIGLFKAVTEDEIFNYFKLVKHDIDRKKISRSIFCLIKLDLIHAVNKGNKLFYIPIDQTQKRYMTLTGSTDSARLALQLDEYYKHSSQLTRREAIKDVVRASL